MNRTVTFALSILLSFLVGNVAAADVNISGFYKQHTRYHGTNGAIFDPDPASQFSATASSEHCWYGGVWIGRDFDGEHDFGDEEDLFGGKCGEFYGLSYDSGAQIFFIEKPTADSGDVLNLYLKLSKSFEHGQWSLTPYVKFDRYLPIGEPLPGDGENVQIGIEMARDFGRWSFLLTPHVLHDTGAFGFEPNELVFVNGSFGYNIDGATRISFIGRYSEPLSSDPVRDGEFTWGLQVNGGFDLNW